MPVNRFGHIQTPQQEDNEESEQQYTDIKQKMDLRNKSFDTRPFDAQNIEVNPNRVLKSDPKAQIIKKHRVIILGQEKVGKTCLFLRYMYFDKSKGINIKQTPQKDGHIFTKKIKGKQFLHEYEIWDFLNKNELD